MKATIGRIVLYSNGSSGKLRPGIIVESPYEDTELSLVAVFEPHATPVGLMYVEAAEITEAEAVRAIPGWFWPALIPEPTLPKDEKNENLTVDEKIV